ncbi:hypothetical protein P7E43_10650 [Enterococcus gallinarum]|uniref:hypothetical protein n=1 Tax=Enterococcus gallinarum TaxID=1353 RepID=UPI00288FAC7F|nr:hypothetical protein [Enterococcus gallinarum]MDT2697522.1 hypothetical protein [Enterococcus gallinarum]
MEQLEFSNIDLKHLIFFNQNDIACGNEDKELFLIGNKLIVELTRLILNFRYCSKEWCPCSPESGICSILKTQKGQEYLKEMEYFSECKKISEKLKGLLSEKIKLSEEG